MAYGDETDPVALEDATFIDMKANCEKQMTECDEQIANCEKMIKTLRAEKKKWQKMLNVINTEDE